MEKGKLRIAVIGQGRSGRDIHGKFFKNEKNDIIEVTYVVDYDPKRRARALEEYPGCQVMESYTDLYGIEDIDLVVNASYSDQHYSVTRDLITHGFNVVVEKPFAKSRLECDTLIELARRNGVTLAVFQQTFLAPIYTESKRIYDSGIIGNVKQVSIRYNGLARRWDWQTLLSRVAGSVYNTGPHPIGIGLGLIDFDENARVVYSRLDTALTSGDGEDYAKIIIEAPGKPVVDIEINSTDAYSDYNVKLQGDRGTYITRKNGYEMTYLVLEENEPRPVIFESLEDADGYPMYCTDNLIKHTESGEFAGTPFDLAVDKFYHQVYDKIVVGAPMTVTPEMAADIISVIETVHAQNPLPLKYPTVKG